MPSMTILSGFALVKRMLCLSPSLEAAVQVFLTNGGYSYKFVVFLFGTWVLIIFAHIFMFHHTTY